MVTSSEPCGLLQPQRLWGFLKYIGMNIHLLIGVHWTCQETE